MAAVEMYSTRFCGFCVAAKSLLLRRGVRFEEVDVSRDHDKRAWLRSVTGRRTVPQIFIGGRSIGGYAELVALDRSGELERMLTDSQHPDPRT